MACARTHYSWPIERHAFRASLYWFPDLCQHRLRANLTVRAKCGRLAMKRGCLETG
jgi:hypothetical protein